MKLLIFLSGTCFGAVAGVLVGYLVMADEVRERRQLREAGQRHEQPEHAHAGGGDGKAPTMDRVRARIGELKERATKEPTDPRPWLELAEIYREVAPSDARFWKQVIEYTEKARALRPRDPDILHNLGTAYHHDGQPEKAVERLKQALAIDPKHEYASFGLALAAFGQGRYKEAGELLDKAATVASSEDMRDRIASLRKRIEARLKEPK